MQLNSLLQRPNYLKYVDFLFQNHPIVALLGPRQCGKTTLAKAYGQYHYDFKQDNYFDLEDRIDLARLAEPQLTLESLEGLIIIDEIQRQPELFPSLRVLVDRPNKNQRILILGSASRDLIRQSSESLAGRIAYCELTPFSYFETREIDNLWLQGGFPKSYLAGTLQQSFTWREFYIQTFFEQDLPNLGIIIPPVTLRRFWMMLAHYHGNIVNYAELGRSFGISDKTVRKYIDILSGTFMIRQLQPWHENISKRQVKSEKVYLRDSGLLHNLLNILHKTQLHTHPKLGASWEGFALEQIIRIHQTDHAQFYFWATHSGAELDLLMLIGSQRIGFEFKYQDAPKRTKSMHSSIENLKLDHLYVIYPGKTNYPLSEIITVKGLQQYLDEIMEED